MVDNISESRIKALRKEMRVKTESDGKVRSLSREALGEYLNCTRQRIAAMESDINIATVGEIKKLCELFECDAAYLLGEIQTKRRIIADIQEQTSLSESAVSSLTWLTSNKLHVDGAFISLDKKVNGVPDDIDTRAFLDCFLSDYETAFAVSIYFSDLITEGTTDLDGLYRFNIVSEIDKFLRNAVEKARKAVAHGKADKHSGLDSGPESLED